MIGVYVYLIIGFVFSIIFLAKGIQVTDELAKESSWGFKLIILPGLIILWPVSLYKWIKRK